MFQKALRLLGSLKLTLSLILALLGIFVLGQVIPQRAQFSDAYLFLKTEKPEFFALLDFFSFFEIYTSPLTALCITLFFVNLIIVMGFRARSMAAICGLPRLHELAPESAHARVEAPDEAAMLEALRKRLKGYWFRVEGGSFVALKYRFGPLGHLLFHVSFFMFLAGGLMIFYTRAVGTVKLTEGEPFASRPSEFENLWPSYLGETPAVDMVVRDISPVFEGFSTLSIKTQIDVYQGSGIKTRTLDVNHPASLGDTSVLILDVGISPLIMIEGPEGELYLDAYVPLRLQADRPDEITLRGTDLRMLVEFYPDHYREFDEDGTRSVEMKNPVFKVAFYRGDDNLFSGLMRAGETVRIGNGFTLYISEIRYWGKFFIVSERGAGWLYLGFATGFIGLVWRFFFYRREVRGQIRDGWLCLSVKSEYFQQQAEERLLRLALRLEKDYN